MADESSDSEERINEDLMTKYEDDNRYLTWTECIGLESMNETSKTEELESPATPPGRTTVESRSRNAEKTTQPNEFPAKLLSLAKNGQPRFYLVKTRGNGQLQIVMVPTNHPAVLVERTPGEGDKVRIRFNNDDDFDHYT
ncbi:Hypothetical predicted protein [Olea europaea subsp. europaea]|uniref:Uncharacterized protein n=1 Tax=Olea europaea subsp. europaea TaxID=158383 RepID=A0A8S0T9S4_OLEEU|nr:Hypothetical predicted protein [Olea europaea subsp. europaea]